MTIQRYPYAQVPAEVARHIRELGGRPLNLYRVLANAPPMLKIWVDFAYAVRRECKTPRSLRELMILRTAQLSESFYEWHQHRRMAREAGVPEQQVTELTMWRWSDAFDSRERAALAFTEAMVAGTVNDATHAELAQLYHVRRVRFGRAAALRNALLIGRNHFPQVFRGPCGRRAP